MAGVGARKCEEILDDALEALRLVRQNPQRLSVFGLSAILFGERHFGFAAQNRDGCSQFVRCVGDETFLAIERSVQAIEKPVERLRQMAQFIVGVSNAQTRIQIFGSDPSCLFAHGDNRRKAVASEKISAKAGDDQSHRNDDGERAGKRFEKFALVKKRLQERR